MQDDYEQKKKLIAEIKEALGNSDLEDHCLPDRIRALREEHDILRREHERQMKQMEDRHQM